jgi:hypothetical protein
MPEDPPEAPAAVLAPSTRRRIARLESGGWRVEPPRAEADIAGGAMRYACAANHRSGYRTIGAGPDEEAAVRQALDQAETWVAKSSRRYLVRVVDAESGSTVWQGERILPAWIEAWTFSRGLWEAHGRPVTVFAGRMEREHVIETQEWTFG